MIVSICFGIGVLVMLGLIVCTFGKTHYGYSVEYYKYLENNKRPPPSIDAYYGSHHRF